MKSYRPDSKKISLMIDETVNIDLKSGIHFTKYWQIRIHEMIKKLKEDFEEYQDPFLEF